METRNNNHTTGRHLEQQQLDALSPQLRLGNRDAFAELIRLTQRPLYATIWRILRNHADTDDILQDTYLRFFEHRDKLHPELPVFPYLRKIALNLALNRTRKRQHETISGKMEEVASGLTPDMETEQNETVEQLQNSLDALPQEQRVVILLRVQEGLSYQEIADILEIRPGTVMSRLARAREKMLRYLQLPTQKAKERLPI